MSSSHDTNMDGTKKEHQNMAVVIKNATKGVIFSYACDKTSSLKYRIFNLEEHFKKKTFDIKLLYNKGVDIVASGNAFISDIVFSNDHNKEILTPEYYKIDKNFGAYVDKLAAALKSNYPKRRFRSSPYNWYNKRTLKTVDYYDPENWTLTYKMRGFTDLHAKYFDDDHKKNIDGVTAFSLFLLLKTKNGELEEDIYYECEEEEVEEESEYEVEKDSEEEINEENESKEIKSKCEDSMNNNDGEGTENKEKYETENKDGRKMKIKDKTEGDKENITTFEEKDISKCKNNTDDSENRNSLCEKVIEDPGENSAEKEDSKEASGSEEKESESEETESESEEDFSSADETLDWDSQDELNDLMLYKDKPEIGDHDKTWIFRYFEREYSPEGSMKWYRALKDDKQHDSSYDSYYSDYCYRSCNWEALSEYLHYVKKPKGLRPHHLKALKSVDFNCIYIEHESIVPESIEIRERNLPKMFEKQSKVLDLYDKGSDEPYGTIIEINGNSPPLNDYEVHSDEGYYYSGINFYSKDQGIVLTGEQNMLPTTMFYGMAVYDEIFIPDVFYDDL